MNGNTEIWTILFNFVTTWLVYNNIVLWLDSFTLPQDLE